MRWGNNKALKGFDGNKKVKGIKLHVIIDKNVFLVAIMVTVANIHYSKAVMLLMSTIDICKSSKLTLPPLFSAFVMLLNYILRIYLHNFFYDGIKCWLSLTFKVDMRRNVIKC